MKAIVDVELCTGCGLCEETCPEVFKLDSEDIAEVIADPVAAEDEDTCRQAAEDCPTEAITLEE